MSFADLRSARKSKESKSLVTRSGTTPSTDTDRGNPTDPDDTKSEIVVSKDATVEVFHRPSGLPETVGIRQSVTEGRGLYANVPLQPGNYSRYE